MSETKGAVSAKAIMDRLDAIVAATAPLALEFSPKALVLYKPNPRAKEKGRAAKFSYRVRPVVNDKGYTNYDAAFFAEIVPPDMSKNGKYVEFDWSSDGAGLSVKLGLPDISAFLLGYREVRLKNGTVPPGIRPIVKTDAGWVPSSEGNSVGLVHKFEDTMTTIKWTFHPEKGSLFEISRGRDEKQVISMNLQEEIQVIAYLELGMKALLMANG